MSKKFCNHEENRKKVCAPCGNKIVLGQKKIWFFKINSTIEKLIQQLLKNEKFNLNDSKYPLSICNTCRNILYEHAKNICVRPLPTMPKYENIILSRHNTRSFQLIGINIKCYCYICLKARMTVHEKFKVGPGIK